jgi:hypothetical protein
MSIRRLTGSSERAITENNFASFAIIWPWLILGRVRHVAQYLSLAQPRPKDREPMTHDHHLEDAIRANVGVWRLFVAFAKDMRVILGRWRVINRLKRQSGSR